MRAAFVGFGEVNTPAEIILKKMHGRRGIPEERGA